MAKYKLKASAWVAGSDIDFGIDEFDNEDDAAQAAFDSAADRIDAWAELVEDDE